MAIGSVDNTTGIMAPTTDLSAATSGANQLGPDDFMKLLVAQLKNQDPDNPTDTKELVTQLSQLTSVQELESMNTQLTSLTTATTSNAANSSSGLIGKTVTGIANQADIGATGSASSAVTLGESADKATVSVSDSTGKVVKTFSLPTTNAGSNAFTWDGTDTLGRRVAAGTYSFSVDAQDAAGNSIATDMSVSGIVTGVDYDNGTPQLAIGSARVALSNVTTISQ